MAKYLILCCGEINKVVPRYFDECGNAINILTVMSLNSKTGVPLYMCSTRIGPILKNTIIQLRN